VNKFKTFKGACLVAATSMLPLSQVAMAEVSISGWANEGITFYDDGVSSDAVQVSDNGTTLGTRMTFSGNTDVTDGLNAGFEIILEPSSSGELLGWGSSSGLNDNSNGHAVGVLGNSVNVSGAWGKVTVGLQSMPTDNIAVLEDPSLTLWSSISPLFRGNAVTITGLGAGATNSTWGSFLQCLTVPGLGIGIDCNGIYRQGVRYDLPAFGPVTVAIGYANDDVYDIAAKWKGSLGRVNGSVALGYAINQGGGGSNVGGDESENFQVQGGLMDPVTGLFGSIAYQIEEADGPTAASTAGSGDDTDAWWLKVGMKKGWFAAGDTSLSFQYGQYSDQYGAATLDVTGSEVERIGVSVDQYFGSNLIIYGIWENLDLDVDGGPLAAAAYSGADELDMFTLGATYFF
jgi:predicted porin